MHQSIRAENKPFHKGKRRPYYTIAQAAAELDTDIDHLLLLGVMGDAQIVVRPRGGFQSRALIHKDAKLLEPEPWTHHAFAFLMPTTYMLHGIERYGAFNIAEYGAVDLLFLEPGQKTPESYVDYVVKSNVEGPLPRVWIEVMMIVPAEKLVDNMSKALREPLLINRDDLYLFGTEVDALREGATTVNKSESIEQNGSNQTDSVWENTGLGKKQATQRQNRRYGRIVARTLWQEQLTRKDKQRVTKEKMANFVIDRLKSLLPPGTELPGNKRIKDDWLGDINPEKPFERSDNEDS